MIDIEIELTEIIVAKEKEIKKLKAEKSDLVDAFQSVSVELHDIKVIIKTSREDILTIARTDAAPLIVKMALSGIADNLKLPEIAPGMEVSDD